MKVLITEKILKQNFELVGDVIGDILFTELENQKEIQSFEEKHTVWRERITSVDKSEEVVIIVLLDGFNSSYATQSDQQNRTNYFIDIYATGKGNSEITGDEVVAMKLQKYAGLCRYILQSHKYVTLGLPPGIIGNKNVDSGQMFEQQNTQDAGYSRMFRLGFSVKLMENQDLWKGLIINQNITSSKLELTEKGYQYKLNT